MEVPVAIQSNITKNSWCVGCEGIKGDENRVGRRGSFPVCGSFSDS